MDEPNDFGSAFDAGRCLSSAWSAIKRNAPLLWLGGCVRGCLRGGGGGGGGSEDHDKSSALLHSGWDSLAHLGGLLPHPAVGAGGFGFGDMAITGLAVAVGLVLVVVTMLVYAWFVPGWLKANAEIVRTGRSSFGTLFGTTEPFGRMLGWILLKGVVLLGVAALVIVPAAAAVMTDTVAVRVPAAIVAVVGVIGLIYAELGLALGDYLVALDGARPMEALEQSWTWVKGNRWSLLFFYVIVAVVSGVFGLAGMCVFLVGALVTIPLANAMFDHAVTDAYLRFTRPAAEQEGWAGE